MSIPSNNNAYHVRVNIWDTDGQTGDCGHASIDLNQTEEGIEKKNRYLGFFPKNGFSPLHLPFSVKAESIKSYQKEVEHMGDGETSLGPSRQFEIPLNEKQYTKMKKELKTVEDEIQTGKTRYALFPNFNTLHALKWLSSKAAIHNYNSCPITGIPMDNADLDTQANVVQETKLANCTTTVIRILRAGEIPVESKKTPWGLTPTGLGNQICNLHIAQL
jgi:hypothetical protein